MNYNTLKSNVFNLEKLFEMYKSIAFEYAYTLRYMLTVKTKLAKMFGPKIEIRLEEYIYIV